MISDCEKCRLNSDKCGHYDHTSDQPCLFYKRPIDNSKMFSHWYSLTGRIGRMEYAITLIASIILGTVLCMVVILLDPSILVDKNFLQTFFINIAIFGLPCYLAIVAGIKRTNDAGLPRKWAYMPVLFLFLSNIFTLLLFLGCSIYLLKEPGEEGINEYGSNPAQPYESQLT